MLSMADQMAARTMHGVLPDLENMIQAGCQHRLLYDLLIDKGDIIWKCQEMVWVRFQN